MQPPTKKTLAPFAPDTVSLSLRLNADVISHFQQMHKAQQVPKLVVKNGLYAIRISDEVEFPCSVLPEYSNLDVYQKTPSGNFRFEGRVKSKLAVLTDPRQIQQHLKNSHAAQSASSPEKTPQASAQLTTASLSTPASPLNFDPYLTHSTDSPAETLLKFLSFMALGPTTPDNLAKHTSIPQSQLHDFTAKYCQPYNPNDTFIIDDVFPNNMQVSDTCHLILKDKAYKDLRPWEWNHYSANERSLIIKNINNALTRLGYPETHPLRKRIVDPPDTAASTTQRKPASLGGGILVSKRISPFKKSHTESPKLKPVEKDLKDIKTMGSPLKRKRIAAPAPVSQPQSSTKKRNLSSSSSGSSDDEHKRFKATKEEYTSPSSVNDDADDDDVPLDKRNNNLNNSVIKFKLKYKEYEKLYQTMRDSRFTNSSDIKKNITNLFELHQHLLELKNKVWKLTNDPKTKSDIMNLSKHKKTPSSSSAAKPTSSTSASALAPTKAVKKKILNY